MLQYSNVPRLDGNFQFSNCRRHNVHRFPWVMFKAAIERFKETP